LNKSVICNKIKFIINKWETKINGGLSKRNTPFLMLRGTKIDHLFNKLYKWNNHPHFEYSLRPLKCKVSFD